MQISEHESDDEDIGIDVSKQAEEPGTSTEETPKQLPSLRGAAIRGIPAGGLKPVTVKKNLAGRDSGAHNAENGCEIMNRAQGQGHGGGKSEGENGCESMNKAQGQGHGGGKSEGDRHLVPSMHAIHRAQFRSEHQLPAQAKRGLAEEGYSGSRGSAPALVEKSSRTRRREAAEAEHPRTECRDAVSRSEVQERERHFLQVSRCN